MELYPVDDDLKLLIGPEIDDWPFIENAGVTVIFDFDGDVDLGVPTVPDRVLYLYFPFDDQDSLPDLDRLHTIGRFGADLIRAGHKVLSHCGMGHNRSALVAGVILYYLGLTGEEIVPRIQSRRCGALYNKVFRNYLSELRHPALSEA